MLLTDCWEWMDFYINPRRFVIELIFERENVMQRRSLWYVLCTMNWFSGQNMAWCCLVQSDSSSSNLHFVSGPSVLRLWYHLLIFKRINLWISRFSFTTPNHILFTIDASNLVRYPLQGFDIDRKQNGEHSNSLSLTRDKKKSRKHNKSSFEVRRR